MTGVNGRTWVGIDPGSRWTGVVARAPENTFVVQRVVDREEVDPDSHQVTRVYLSAVMDAISEVIASAGPDSRIAVEEAVKPVGYEFVRPFDLIGLGMVVGCLMTYFPDAVLVRPGKHGQRPLHTYPLELSTPGERAHATRNHTWGRPAPQSNAIRHARSAWDVAGAGPTNERIAAAVAKQRKTTKGGR